MCRKIISLISLYFLLCISQASALTVDIGYGYGEYVPAGITFMGTSQTTGAGEFLLAGDVNSVAYCINYGVHAGIGSDFTAELTDPLSYDDGNYFQSTYATSGQYAVWLMKEFSVGLGYDPGTLNPGYSKCESAVALQLAIWDAIYDFDGTDFDNGVYGSGSRDVFQYTGSGDVKDLFDYFENELVTRYSLIDSSDFKGALIEKNNEHYQTLLVYQPVPEPATILLFGFGLLGIGAIGRKRT